MSLSTGSRLGPYEIVSPLGAGGMGEVYKARDMTLDRDVAIKILPDAFVADPERVARFQREAKTLALLSHPNIGGIYGLEERDGVTALVMELVEGEDLSVRIARGAIPIDEALPIAEQIAEALEAAHEQGIIHRDLKPANIKVRRDGTVKVLDFGLAKGMEAPGSSSNVSRSPTITTPAMTQAGMILGTAAYMSPEQAKGRTVDRRADVWAFGAVLYEMLTGQRVFAGEDVSDTLANVLKIEPDWERLPADVPARIRQVLRACLQKNAKQRIGDVQDVRLALEGAFEMALPQAAARVRVPLWRRLTALTGGALVVGAVTGTAVWVVTRPVPPHVTRFDVAPSAAAPFAIGPAGVNLAISPDGTRVAYHARHGGIVSLELRRLDQLENQALAGTDGATQMAFSPDGSSIVFFKDRKLQRLSVGAKAPVILCDAFNVAGTSWANDTIVFAQAGDEGGLFRVSANGGKPERVTAPNAQNGEQDYVHPDVLPGGMAVFFTVRPAGAGIAQAKIAVRDLERGDQKILIEGGSYPRYVAAGYLFFVQASTLMAVRFDAKRLEVVGSPVSVQEGIGSKGNGVGNYGVSRDGTLVYVARGAVAYVSRFVWKDRVGRLIGPAAGDQLEAPRYPRLSPDGRRLAFTAGPSNEGNIWIYDLASAAQPLKLTFTAHNTFPTWTMDGKRIVFNSTRDGSGSARNLYSLPADSSVLEPEQLVASVNFKSPLAWSPDGQSLMFSEISPKTGPHLWILPAGGDRKPHPWLNSTFTESEASFSPDGRSVAYVSDQTGQPEIWVRPFPGPGFPIRVSSVGGHDPVWAHSGGELFYQEGTKLMVAEGAGRQPDLRFKTPHLLFDGGFISYDPNTPRTYDVSADGRFLMVEQTPT